MRRSTDSARLRIRFKTAKRRIAFKVSHQRLPVGPLDPGRTPDKDRALDELTSRPSKKKR